MPKVEQKFIAKAILKNLDKIKIKLENLKIEKLINK